MSPARMVMDGAAGGGQKIVQENLLVAFQTRKVRVVQEEFAKGRGRRITLREGMHAVDCRLRRR